MATGKNKDTHPDRKTGKGHHGAGNGGSDINVWTPGQRGPKSSITRNILVKGRPAGHLTAVSQDKLVVCGHPAWRPRSHPWGLEASKVVPPSPQVTGQVSQVTTHPARQSHPQAGSLNVLAPARTRSHVQGCPSQRRSRRQNPGAPGCPSPGLWGEHGAEGMSHLQNSSLLSQSGHFPAHRVWGAGSSKPFAHHSVPVQSGTEPVTPRGRLPGLGTMNTKFGRFGRNRPDEGHPTW